MSVPTEDTLRRLAGAIRDQGGLLAGALDGAAPRPPADGDPALGAFAAAGPRAAGRREDVAFVVEAIREGYLLHYGDRGASCAIDDRDLALLAGDRLYALGLARLAALGDLAAVSELADVIALVRPGARRGPAGPRRCGVGGGRGGGRLGRGRQRSRPRRRPRAPATPRRRRPSGRRRA